MSDAANPNKEFETPESVLLPEAKTERVARSGSGLAALALLIGLGGATAGGWSVWQLQQLHNWGDEQTATLKRLQNDSAERVDALAQRLDSRLAALPSAAELDERRRLLAQLQSDQQRLSQRLETALDGSRQDWRLDEAEQLMRLANLRLSALQDVVSAEALVKATDDILRQQDDPAAFAAREQLSRSLEALRTTARPDRVGLFLQLAALRDQAAELNPLAPRIQGDGDVLSELAAEQRGQGWWVEWLAKAGEYFRIDFNADRNVRPILAGQSLAQVRLSLSLALEQAQWAAVHGHGEVYAQSLASAKDILNAYFDVQNPDSRALLQRIDELAAAPVDAPVPDLTPAFESLQAYIERKKGPRQSEAPAEEVAP